jgi:hypothetical protein
MSRVKGRWFDRRGDIRSPRWAVSTSRGYCPSARGVSFLRVLPELANIDIATSVTMPSLIRGACAYLLSPLLWSS